MGSETFEPAAAAATHARSRPHWGVLGAAAVCAFGLFVLGWLLTPDARGVGTHEQLGLNPCLPMEVWNFPCPGCGVTTSVTLAMQGRYVDSFLNQPFGFLCALGGVLFIVWAVVGHLRGRDLWRDLERLRYGPWLATVAFLLALAWGYKIGLVRGWFE